MARPQFCVTPGLVVLASLVALSCLRSTKADVGVVSAAAAGAVHVSTGRALVEALMNDAARVIVLDQDVRFETSDWPQQPYTLAHNVTVTSDRNGPHRVRWAGVGIKPCWWRVSARTAAARASAARTDVTRGAVPAVRPPPPAR
jgi:hypothetical protein